jgi:hypothetical protein
MKLKLALLGVALGFSSAAQAGAYNCAFEVNQAPVNQCSIDSASPSTAKCSYLFAGTNLTGVCVVVAAGAEDLVACQVGVVVDSIAAEPSLAKVVQSKSAAAALVALAQLPGFAAAAATIAPTNKASIHLGYYEKQGAPLFSAICPATFGKQ